MDQATAQSLGTILGWIVFGVFGYIGSRLAGRSQRNAVNRAATKIDESTKRQEEANELLRKTLTDALSVKDNQIADDRQEISALRSDLTNYKEALDTTLHEVDNMRADMRGMRSEHDQRIREMQIQIDGLLKENTAKERQLNVLAKAVQDRENLIGGQVQKLERFERALADKDSQLNDALVQLKEAQTLINTLRQNEAKNEAHTADELDKLRERVRNLEQQVSKLNAERDLLIAERDTARAEAALARNEAEAAKAERDAAKVERAELLKRIETLEGQIRVLQAAKAESTLLNERAEGAV